MDLEQTTELPAAQVRAALNAQDGTLASRTRLANSVMAFLRSPQNLPRTVVGMDRASDKDTTVMALVEQHQTADGGNSFRYLAGPSVVSPRFRAAMSILREEPDQLAALCRLADACPGVAVTDLVADMKAAAVWLLAAGER